MNLHRLSILEISEILLLYKLIVTDNLLNENVDPWQQFSVASLYISQRSRFYRVLLGRSCYDLGARLSMVT